MQQCTLPCPALLNIAKRFAQENTEGVGSFNFHGGTEPVPTCAFEKAMGPSSCLNVSRMTKYPFDVAKHQTQIIYNPGFALAYCRHRVTLLLDIVRAPGATSAGRPPLFTAHTMRPSPLCSHEHAPRSCARECRKVLDEH